MKKFCFDNQAGFSLIELTIALIIISILVGVSMQQMTSVMEDSRQTKTEREMESLSHSIVGNPNVTGNSGRTDFGYVGDVGAFPPNLNALYTNPGGYATWKGPYIPVGFAQDSTGLKTDEWGAAYNYSGNVTITSTGSGSIITKTIARATSDYLRNTINGIIKDGANSLPDSTYKDSVDVFITFPNGVGGSQTKLYHPDSAGNFTLDSIPVGTHQLRIIFTPNVDTLFRYLTVYPRHKSSKTYKFASSYFTVAGGGGEGIVIIRPNGTGDYSVLNSSGCASNWQCVDEASSDDDGTYVENIFNYWIIDTYAAEDPVGTGTIDSLVVYMRVRNNGSNQQARTALLVDGTEFYGTNQNLDGVTSYTDYSTTYINNPAIPAAWTWSELNNIQIGVSMRNPARCTQVWAEIYYRL